jgi:hypothetical protein
MNRVEALQSYRKLNAGSPPSFTVSCSPSSGNQQACTFVFDQVPAGRRLVIEKVSGFVSMQSGGNLLPIFLAQGGSGQVPLAHLPFVLLPGSVGTLISYGVIVDVKQYVEGGQYPYVYLSEIGAPPTMEASLSVSGYLVDLTQ